MVLLKDWFCPDDQTDYFHMEFRQCVANEDATAFGHAVKQLGQWAYTMFPVVEVEKAIVVRSSLRGYLMTRYSVTCG